MLSELVKNCRTVRRFRESETIEAATLRGLVDLARLSASGGNQQPLKFLLSNTPEMNERIFPSLAWAAALKDWAGPAAGERPAAYIVILGDKDVSKGFGVDHGIAAQSIMLGAMEKGVAGCMIGSIQRDKLRQSLNIPERFDILLVLALGKPAETVRVEPLPPDGSTKYWRDAHGVHHVPKRALNDLIVTF